MKKIGIFLIIFLSAFAINAMITPVRRIDFGDESDTFFNFPTLLGFILYFSISFIFIKKFEKHLPPATILFSMLMGLSLVQLPLRILYFEETLISLLEYLTEILAILMSYICFKLNTTNIKIFFSIACFLGGGWISTIGHNKWSNKINYGTFNGIVNDNIHFDVKLQSEIGDTLYIEEFKDKYLLLECWYTHCGECYRAFPKVQQLYDRYKGNKLVSIYTLHVRIGNESETFHTGNQILKKEGYNIPTLSIDGYDPILKELGVKGYPTILIFNKENKLIYRGDLEGAEKLINKLTKNNTL